MNVRKNSGNFCQPSSHQQELQREATQRNVVTLAERSFFLPPGFVGRGFFIL